MAGYEHCSRQHAGAFLRAARIAQDEREGDHDDLIFSVALCCWAGGRFMRRMMRVMARPKRTVAVVDPGGFIYAFGKLEQAIEELVGAGDVKERLEVAAMTLSPIFADDFPAGHLRDEYADIRQALTWLPPQEGSGQGLAESILEAMMEEKAGALAKSLFSLYTDAAEALHGR